MCREGGERELCVGKRGNCVLTAGNMFRRLGLKI